MLLLQSACLISGATCLTRWFQEVALQPVYIYWAPVTCPALCSVRGQKTDRIFAFESVVLNPSTACFKHMDTLFFFFGCGWGGCIINFSLNADPQRILFDGLRLQRTSLCLNCCCSQNRPQATSWLDDSVSLSIKLYSSFAYPIGLFAICYNFRMKGSKSLLVLLFTYSQTSALITMNLINPGLGWLCQIKPFPIMGSERSSASFDDKYWKRNELLLR